MIQEKGEEERGQIRLCLQQDAGWQCHLLGWEVGEGVGLGGVDGHDQESCFGLVNFEMLVRCPRRDAKWPVG